jgi:hypothetical protein
MINSISRSLNLINQMVNKNLVTLSGQREGLLGVEATVARAKGNMAGARQDLAEANVYIEDYNKKRLFLCLATCALVTVILMIVYAVNSKPIP